MGGRFKIWLAIIITYSGTCTADQNSELFTKLFKDYERAVLPRCETDTGPKEVQIGIMVRQIIDMDEPTQILKTSIWVRLNWNDCRLRWNTTDFDVDLLVIPYEYVWTPDITLYANTDSFITGLTEYRPTVYPDGAMVYNFPSVVTFFCELDVTHFPFDKQLCELKFGSWAYSGLLVNLTERHNAADTSAFMANGEWELVDLRSEHHEVLYGCCPEPYPDVTFYISLKRQARFYTLNLIAPCILMALISVMGFLVPPEAGEKVTLEITVLLSLTVFLLIVLQMMPPTSETYPYVGIYFAVVMLLISLSCLMTVIVLIVHHMGRNGNRVPASLRKILLGRTSSKVDSIHQDDRSTRAGKKKNICTKTITNCNIIEINGESITVEGVKEIRQQDRLLLEDITNNINNVKDETDKLMAKSEACMFDIKALLLERKTMTLIKDEWRILARVIDRVCFVLFTVAHVLTVLILMLKNANVS